MVLNYFILNFNNISDVSVPFSTMATSPKQLSKVSLIFQWKEIDINSIIEEKWRSVISTCWTAGWWSSVDGLVGAISRVM